jgi:hypothetical protein
VAESVADVLGRLRLEGTAVETLYLNQIRVKESFIGQLGAIESFTRTASKEGSIEAPVIKLGAGLSAESGVTWTMTDPTAQVLVLHKALERQGTLRRLTDAVPGSYVEVVGTGSISRPAMLDAAHQSVLRGRPGLYAALEAERAAQENVLRMMEGNDASMWLMTIGGNTPLCASVLDERWLSPSSSSWLTGIRWRVFAMVRRMHETGIPLLATMHISVCW